MKRASYRRGVELIALNDSPGDNDSVEELKGYMSVVLLSELFGVDRQKAATDVFNYRETERRRFEGLPKSHAAWLR